MYFTRSTKPIVNYTIIGLNILIFLWELRIVGPSLLSNGANTQQLFQMGGMQTLAYNSGQHYRLWSSMFLHASLTHILGNMSSLIFVGNILEDLIGHVRYLLVYILSGVGSAYLSLLFLNPNTVSVGASGAVFGIIGCLLIVTMFCYSNWKNGVVSALLYTILINLGISIIDPSINLYAHLGGLITGIVCGIIILIYFFIAKVIKSFNHY